MSGRRGRKSTSNANINNNNSNNLTAAHINAHYNRNSSSQQNSEDDSVSGDDLSNRDSKKKLSANQSEDENSNFNGDNYNDNKINKKIRKNTREKQRREELNEKFDRLAALLNLQSNHGKIEKSKVLSDAISMIERLTRIQNEQKIEISELKQEVAKANAALQAAWTSTIQSHGTPSPQAVAMNNALIRYSSSSSQSPISASPNHHNLNNLSNSNSNSHSNSSNSPNVVPPLLHVSSLPGPNIIFQSSQASPVGSGPNNSGVMVVGSGAPSASSGPLSPVSSNRNDLFQNHLQNQNNLNNNLYANGNPVPIQRQFGFSHMNNVNNVPDFRSNSLTDPMVGTPPLTNSASFSFGRPYSNSHSHNSMSYSGISRIPSYSRHSSGNNPPSSAVGFFQGTTNSSLSSSLVGSPMGSYPNSAGFHMNSNSMSSNNNSTQSNQVGTNSQSPPTIHTASSAVMKNDQISPRLAQLSISNSSTPTVPYNQSHRRNISTTNGHFSPRSTLGSPKTQHSSNPFSALSPHSQPVGNGIDRMNSNSGNQAGSERTQAFSFHHRRKSSGGPYIPSGSNNNNNSSNNIMGLNGMVLNGVGIQNKSNSPLSIFRNIVTETNSPGEPDPSLDGLTSIPTYNRISSLDFPLQPMPPLQTIHSINNDDSDNVEGSVNQNGNSNNHQNNNEVKFEPDFNDLD